MRGLLVENRVVVAVHKVTEIAGPYVADPGGVGVDWTDDGGGAFSAPAQAPHVPTNKETRDAALRAMSYDFGDGRVIQTRPQDELNVRTAIEVMTANGIASRNWVMADNVKHPVNAAELQTALTAGQLAAVQIWDDYEPE